jgi:UDP-glucose 4-epimerase
MPFLVRVAAGQLDELKVFGSDYDTRDGSGVRDYIHVEDLAYGHLKALEYVATNPGWQVFNLGTGAGLSVLELISAFESETNRRVKWRFAPRRPGDIATSYADASLAESKLQWKARRGVDDMCRSAWAYFAQIYSEG